MKLNKFLDMINNTESNQLCLDFDGVIHDSYQGFHDGTIYGDPLPGALEAVKYLSAGIPPKMMRTKIINDIKST